MKTFKLTRNDDSIITIRADRAVAHDTGIVYFLNKSGDREGFFNKQKKRSFVDVAVFTKGYWHSFYCVEGTDA